MKKLLLILTLFFTYMYSQEIVINERVNDIYFANGMMAERWQADKSLNIIRSATLQNIYSSNIAAIKRETTYKLLYNQTYGFYADVLEIFNQKKAEHKYFWITAEAVIKIAAKTTMIGIATDTAKDKLVDMIAKELLNALLDISLTKALDEADLGAYKNLVDAVREALKKNTGAYTWKLINSVSDFLKEIDLNKQFDALTQSVSSGHQAIIIAHSQGNFFANELESKFDAQSKHWMKQYIKTISISSPANKAAFDGSHITYNNDPTTNWPDRVGSDTSNPLRYRRFYLQYDYNGTLSDEEVLSLIDEIEAMSMPEECNVPLGFYFEDDIAPSCYNNASIAVFDIPTSKFHPLEYYMQEELVSDTGTVRQNPSRKVIMDFMKSSITSFRTASSQWEVEESRNCEANVKPACIDRLKTAQHKYDDSLNQYMQSMIVYPFAKGDSKLYPAGEDKYIKAKSLLGDNIIENDNSDVCYTLVDDDNNTLERIYNSNDPVTQSKNGYIEVSIAWQNANVDMDLRVMLPSGEHDVKDECQLMEHFYVLNDKDVTPGLYPVYVTYSGLDINESLKEVQDIVVTIKVPGATEARTVNLKTIDSLSGGGHIADIRVEERKVEVVLKDTFSTSSTVLYYRPESGYSTAAGGSGGYSGGYTGGGSASGGWTYSYTPPPTKDYIYSIIWHISQALLGPIAGADIAIYELKDYDLNTNKGSNPLYSGVSSYGSSIHTAGVINIPREIMDSLGDEKLYIVEAKGGADIDANDDKIADALPTNNLGSVRAVTSGSALKNIGFKVNILTEIAYQISKKYYESSDISRLINKSDETVKCLLRDDINLDNVTNTIDALYFTPYGDMDKLYRNYRNEFMPIINQLHKGEDIYEESFNLYAKPLVKGGYFSVNEDAATGTTIGKIETDCISESPVYSFSLSGTGAENFEVDSSGNLKVAKPLVYEERRIYSLSVTGINSYGNSPAANIYITVTADNSPIITNTFTNYVFENMPNGSFLGQIGVNDMGYPVTSMRLEGYGAQYFSIDKDGRITVAHGENITLSDKAYRLMVTAENVFGDSAPVSVVFNIYDDVPVILDELYITIKDDIAGGTSIGKPSYYSGLSNIKEFKLEGYGAENFNVSIDGTIRVSQNATIKLEDSPYRLYISAENEQGVGEPRAVTINVVSSQISHSITLDDFGTNIYVSAGNNSVVGKISYHYSYASPKAFSLSGEGSERFSISSNGVITLTDNSGLNAGEVFNLEANASNEYTASGKSQVKITVIDDTPYLYNFSVSIMEGLEAGTAIGKVGYSYGASPITEFEIAGSDDFTIDNGGTIRIKEGASINYDVKNLYTFTIKGVNSIGNMAESSASVRVIDDAPVLRNSTFSIMENSYGGEYVGRVSIVSNGKSVIEKFTLSGEGAEHFTIDKNGNIKTAIGAVIDYETKSIYNLKAAAQNAHDTSSEVNVTINVTNVPDQEPVLIPTTFSIDENSPSGTYIGDMGIYAHGHSTITSFVITGTNSDWFSIDSTGKITTTDLANLDYESKKVFTLKVKAISAYGESTLIDLTINVNNVPDLPPVIQSSTYRFYIDENSPAETFAGQLNINSDDSPVTSVVLSGTGAENFKVYNNGTIVVAEGANLDYESIKVFNLKAKASNIYGDSNTVDVTVNVNNVPDSPPVIQSATFYVDENSPEGTIVGRLSINDYGSPVTSILLSGDGNENFKVYNNGTIVVAEGAKLDYESRNYYPLEAKAVNAFGESNMAYVDIFINNLKDTRPVLQDTNFSIYRKTPANTTIGVIKVSSSECDITEYVSDDSLVFGIRDNGEVYTNTDILEDRNYIATINVYAKSSCGDSNTINLTIDTQNRIISSIDVLGYSYNSVDSIALSSDDTKVFVGDDEGSLKIFDVSDPAKPELISSIDVSGSVNSIVLSLDNTKAFVSNSNGLKIIDVSNPIEPIIIGQIGTSRAYDIVLSSDETKVFVADGSAGLKIIDVSNPIEPIIIGQIGTSWAYDIALSSDETKVFVADSTNLKVINVSNPINPVLAYTYPISNARTVALSPDNTKIFAIAYRLHLCVIDLKPDGIISCTNQIATAFNITPSLDNRKIFVASGTGGLRVVDVNNPRNSIVILGQINTFWASDVALSSDETKAFVADSFHGFKIIDIEDF